MRKPLKSKAKIDKKQSLLQNSLSPGEGWGEVKLHNMKKIILIKVLILVIFANANAQVNLTLAFNSRPQQYLADWTNSINGRAIVTVQQGTGNAPTTVRFKTTLTDRKSTRLNSSHVSQSRMPSSA